MKKIFTYAIVILGLIGLIYLVAKPIMGKGYIYFRDVTEGIKVDKLYQRYIYTYSDDVGEALAEKARIPLFYLTYSIYNIGHHFGLDDSYYVKVKIILLFLISFLAFLIPTKKLVQNITPLGTEKKVSSNLALLAAFIGGIYYTSNFWFANRIMHFGLFFTTATIPILFYILYSYLFSPEKKIVKLIFLVLILSVLTPTPHTILFEMITFISIFFGYFLSERNEQQKDKILLKHFGIFSVLFLLLNSYWIMPYLVSLSKPDGIVSETIINLIGKYATLQNSVRLMGYWLTDPSSYFPQNLTSLWLTVSYLPLILTLFTLVLLWFKKQKGIFWSILILFFFGVFLATSGQITNIFYFTLIFKTPFKDIGWLLREYDKFGLVLAFVFSTCFSILIGLVSNKRLAIPALLGMLATVLIMNFYFLTKTLVENYSPKEIPNAYTDATNTIESDANASNMAWYPGNPKPFWATSEEVRYVFTNLISPKPSITTKSELINYLDFLFNQENIYSTDLGRALDLVGVKYLVVRKDGLIFQDQNIEDLLTTQASLKKIFGNEILSVYENTRFTGLSKYYANRIETNEGLSFLKHTPGETFNNQDTFIDYTDKPSGVINIPTKYYLNPQNYLDVLISKYSDKFIYPAKYCTKKEDGGPGDWKLGSLENINQAETRSYFNDLGLNTDQFDFNNGIIVAREGWQLASKANRNVSLINLTFKSYPNFKHQGNKYDYSSVDKDFDYYWNIIKSDRFDVAGVKALQVYLETDIPESLVPHFKLMYYDQNGKVSEIAPVYPDERGKVDIILKVPDDAATADFSIWTLSGIKGTGYQYSINKLELSNVNNNVKPVEFTFNSHNTCVGTCIVYARVLDSYLSGLIEMDLNNEVYLIKTKLSDSLIPDRFSWLKVGTISDPGQSLALKFKNLSGFNAVNAVVLLNSNESKTLNEEASSTKDLVLLNGPIQESAPSNSVQISTIELSPTKYEMDISSPQKLNGVIAFAKPYNKGWTFSKSSQPPLLINGYINGWEVRDLESGKYFIEFKPQKFFYLGSIIASTTAVLLVIYLIYAKVVMRSERKSKSQG